MRVLQSILMLVFVVVTVYFVRHDALQAVKNVYNRFTAGEESKTQSGAPEIKSEAVAEPVPKKEVNTPGPLHSALDRFLGTNSASYDLNSDEIIALTNSERRKNGLPALEKNSKLSESAQIKVRDMFAKQYFEHISPSGVGVADLGKKVGYEYITIGENLAMGNFDGSAGVVAAWMASPGHRANILNSKYTEIGVYVMEGTFNGQKVWMAVQHFGRPLSLCPVVETNIKIRIEAQKIKLDSMSGELSALRAKIDAASSASKEYQDLIDEYNSKIPVYNSLAADTKNLIEKYNGEVHDFNACIQKS